MVAGNRGFMPVERIGTFWNINPPQSVYRCYEPENRYNVITAPFGKLKIQIIT